MAAAVALGVCGRAGRRRVSGFHDRRAASFALRLDGHPWLITTNLERIWRGRDEHDIAKPSGEDKNPSYMRFAWVNLGLGVAWPKTLARSGHPAVIGETRLRFGSSPGDAEADKTEERPQFILFCGSGHVPFIQFYGALALQPQQLGNACHSALLPCRANARYRSPCRLNSRQAETERPLAGDQRCAESQSIEPADHGNTRRTTLRSVGAPRIIITMALCLPHTEEL